MTCAWACECLFCVLHFLAPTGSEFEPSGPQSTGGVICSLSHTHMHTQTLDHPGNAMSDKGT